MLQLIVNMEYCVEVMISFRTNFTYLEIKKVFFFFSCPVAYGVPRTGIRSKLHLQPMSHLWQYWILKPTESGWGWKLYPGAADTTNPLVPQWELLKY